jgi:hypothetical protein
VTLSDFIGPVDFPILFLSAFLLGCLVSLFLQ